MWVLSFRDWQRVRAFGLMLACVVALSAVLSVTARAGETVSVRLDQAKLLRLPEKTTTVVVGNPMIADVTLQPGGMLVITGKGFGATNLIAVDKHGAVLTERAVQVTGPEDNVVVVFRGAARESYSCAPNCERRATLGDAKDFFDDTSKQVENRNRFASDANAPASK